jgi:hypothetical protein
MKLGQYGLPAALLLVAATGDALAQNNLGQAQDRQSPIVLAKSGGFVIGGKGPRRS